MGGALRPSLLWLLLVSQPAGPARAEAGATELSGILGDSVTFPVGVPAEQFKTAAWTVNTTNTIATVGAGNPPAVLLSDSSYEGRLRVPAQSYSLQLTGLRVDDTGTYRAQINTATGTVYRRHFTLRVYKRLAESDITVTPVPGSVSIVNGTCSITLNCTVQGAGEDVNCTWAQTVAGTVISTGPSVHISDRLGDEGASVTCTARNPVSSSSKSVSLQDVCAGTDVPAGPSPTLTYCHVKGILLLVVLGALVTASVTVHVRTRDRERLD